MLWRSMTRKQRLRRVATLCCHCLRNLAFYRAGSRRNIPVFEKQFWVNANGNFLDIFVMEWCKLFADSSGKHSWQNVIRDQEGFFNGVLQELKTTETEFENYITEMRSYRDKFVAHLDSKETMHIPKLEVAQNSVSYLYDYLRTYEDEGNFFVDAPKKASTFYEDYLEEGKLVYDEHARLTSLSSRRSEIGGPPKKGSK